MQETKEQPRDTVEISSRKKAYQIIKRGFDFTASLLALLVIWPILLLIALAIRLDTKGPAIYVHERIGRNHRPCYIYKFRSMVCNSDEIKADFSQEQLREWNENFKLVNDPRITRVGRLLRKTSLDELPQLLNVVKGDMSLVGPRPIIQAELDRYGANQEKFLSVLPGLTGYWQAYARNDCTYERRMQMELYYIDHAGIWFDLKIIFKTVGRVLSQKGAC